jgi:hypothetical protein
MSDSADKQSLIMDHERKMAGDLALCVLEKPKPPLWMIFVPVFFVFFAQKMKQYSSAREDFVDNYLKPRRLALEAARSARETGTPLDVDALLEKAGNVPGNARALFVEWMRALAEHYGTLLDARGTTAQALIRSGYRTKTDYLLQCNVLNKAENAFSQSLVGNIEGDGQDIAGVVSRMNACVIDLRRREADAIFS